MDKTCFFNNDVGVSSVVVFGNSFTNTDNFSSNSTGQLCGFASVFENLQQFDNFSPLCVNAGASACLAGTTFPPTSSPSAAPTPALSDSPSNYPSQAPSASPTTSAPTITAAPTVFGQTPAPDSTPGFEFPPDQSAGSGASVVGGVAGLVLSIAVSLLLG